MDTLGQTMRAQMPAPSNTEMASEWEMNNVMMATHMKAMAEITLELSKKTLHAMADIGIPPIPALNAKLDLNNLPINEPVIG